MKCPHCLHLFHSQLDERHVGDGPEGSWNTLHQTCPGCGASIIYLQTREQNFNRTILRDILVYPRGISRMPLSPDVDDPQVIKNYTKSALVLSDSAEASAALSRRCLQHILREKAGIKKGDLSDEIQQVLDQKNLPSEIADNLDIIRNIGNFAAHPIKSRSTGEIVDVEPNEAEWNLDVLEQLIDFYYVKPAIARKKRDELNSKLAASGKPPLKK